MKKISFINQNVYSKIIEYKTLSNPFIIFFVLGAIISFIEKSLSVYFFLWALFFLLVFNLVVLPLMEKKFINISEKKKYTNKDLDTFFEDLSRTDSDKKKAFVARHRQFAKQQSEHLAKIINYYREKLIMRPNLRKLEAHQKKLENIELIYFKN